MYIYRKRSLGQLSSMFSRGRNEFGQHRMYGRVRVIECVQSQCDNRLGPVSPTFLVRAVYTVTAPKDESPPKGSVEALFLERLKIL